MHCRRRVSESSTRRRCANGLAADEANRTPGRKRNADEHLAVVARRGGFRRLARPTGRGSPGPRNGHELRRCQFWQGCAPGPGRLRAVLEAAGHRCGRLAIGARRIDRGPSFARRRWGRGLLRGQNHHRPLFFGPGVVAGVRDRPHGCQRWTERRRVGRRAVLGPYPFRLSSQCDTVHRLSDSAWLFEDFAMSPTQRQGSMDASGVAPGRILVVEDERIVARDLEGALTELGYVVPAAVATGEEAIERARDLQPDVVLMDIRLPGAIDG